MNSMARYLVLVNHEKNEYFPEKCACCILKNYYKTENILHRALRKILLKSQSPFIPVLFSHWYNEVKKVGAIILFDTRNMPEIIRWLRKKFPQKRIIAWYWNSIADSVNPETYKDVKNIEIWSFDKKDCVKYGYQFNTQFYIPENMTRASINDVEHSDIFYVGSDKKRSEALNDLALVFKKNHISYYYHLVRFKNEPNPYNFEYHDPLVYPQVIEYIRKSKVIIDLVAEWQNGITLRPLEGLFFKKKLITNMKEITGYDFYNPQNIFVLGVDDLSHIKEFVESPYYVGENYSELINRYSMQGWLNNFTLSE